MSSAPELSSSAASSSADAANVTSQQSEPPRPLGVSFVFLTLIAAAVAFVVMFYWGSPFMIPKELADLPATAPQDKLALKEVATVAMVRGNTLISFSLLSAIVGGVACAVAGLQRSVQRAAGGCVIGLLVLGATGALMVLLGLQLRAVLHPLPEAILSPMAKTLALHVTVWVGQGLVFGLCVAVQRGADSGLAMPVVAGMMGGLIGGCLYSPLAAIAFPMEDTDRLIPTGFVNGLCWSLVFYGFMAVLLVGLTKPPSKQ